MIRMNVAVLWVGLLLCCAVVSARPLADHPSPYLALHADDPVRWRLLDAAVLEQAQREGKLIFISSGYFACHWCHVMQRESFRDGEVARYLNRHFIPVKLDRELAPALDAYLLDFVQRTRGYAGWPLSVFLTPQGHPLFGAGYLPRDQFLEQLRWLQQRWQATPAELRDLAAAAVETAPPAAIDATPSGAQVRRLLTEQTLADADLLAGGFGDQSKFPSTPLLQALLDIPATARQGELEEFLLLTLEQMQAHGLYDQLGGGFFRYTIDPAWQQPHFEKMLYDNAQLARLYSQAAARFGRDDFMASGRATLSFMLRAMAHPGGGFIAALSAQDAAGEEGGYYLWRPGQLEGLLAAEERRLAIAAYGFGGVAQFDTGYLPLRPPPPAVLALRLGLETAQATARLSRVERKLLAAREQRALPRDGKRISAWNGLALSALAAGTQLPEGEAFRLAGQQLRHFIGQQLWDGKRLLRARGPQGEPLEGATLEDYALVCQGVLEWSEVSGKQEDVQLALQVAEAGWRLFYTGDGWRRSVSDVIPLPQATVLPDSALPSAAAVLGRCSLALARRLEMPVLTGQARRVLQWGATAAAREPLAFASYVAALP